MRLVEHFDGIQLRQSNNETNNEIKGPEKERSLDHAGKSSDMTQKDTVFVRNGLDCQFAHPGSSLGNRNAKLNIDESQKSLRFEVKIDDNSKLKSAAILIKKHRAQSGNANTMARRKQKQTGIEFVPLKVQSEESSHHLAIGK